MSQTDDSRLSHAELLELKRWNTPTIYNGRERIAKAVIAAVRATAEKSSPPRRMVKRRNQSAPFDP